MSTRDRIANEQRLRSSVLRGEEFAWETWYEESFADLLAYVTWRCGGSRDDATEIIQDTWLVAVRQIRKFDPEQGSFASWLRGIAQNVIRNYVRRRAKAQQLLEPLTVDPVCGPYDKVQQAEAERDRIAGALVALPPRYEAVLKAKYLDGLPVNLIASQWCETPSAIESLLTRAREAFRRLYRDPNCDAMPEADAGRRPDTSGTSR